MLCLGLAAAEANAAPQPTSVEPNDPGYRIYPTPFAQIDAPAFWGATSGTECKVKVAVLDSGVVPTPDIHAAQSRDFAPEGPFTPHGTEVASVISATFNNSIGVPGLTNCPVVSGRVIDSAGFWYPERLAPAINWAVAQGVRVINLSLYQNERSIEPPLAQALQTAVARGVLVVIIAGNGSGNDCQGTSDPSGNPLASQTPRAIRVAGVDGYGKLTSCSNYGSALADVAAPYYMPVDMVDGSVSIQGGTSYAAPVVSAIAAEMFDINPAMTPAEVKDCLMKTSTKVPDLDVASGGIVNAYNALTCAGYGSTFKVTVRKSGRGSVAVKSDAPLRALPPSSSVKFTAKPAKGWRFGRWSGLCSGRKTVCRLVVRKDGHVVATFIRRGSQKP